MKTRLRISPVPNMEVRRGRSSSRRSRPSALLLPVQNRGTNVMKPRNRSSWLLIRLNREGMASAGDSRRRRKTSHMPRMRPASGSHIHRIMSIRCCLILRTCSLSPNPPKDTDGRREESGRGGEGATGEIAWVPFGVGRSADGLHRRTGAPMAVCGSCDARDGERIRSRGLSRPGWRESAGIFGCPVGGSVADGAVRPGVEWLAAGPRRG